jgi:hypothetical protein
MPKKPCRESENYDVHTSQEFVAVGHAAADGRGGRNYTNSEAEGARIHRSPGAAHMVSLAVGSDEPGFGPIEELTREQDADSHLAILYIAALLAPPMMQPPTAEDCWISFDDVISKIGWDPRSTEERREMHRRIYRILQFGARAKVYGQRGKDYVDPKTKKKIDTVIESSLWQIHEVERPEQLALSEETPVRAQVLITPRWLPFLNSAQLAQYLPLGELLGSIPGNKPSGAWARVIGLSLASFWRRNKSRVLDGSLMPTRRDLLETYPPKTGSVEDLLASTNPGFALNYWHGALQLLVESGFIEPTGEASITVAQARAQMPRKDWSQAWLNGKVDIQPKADMKTVLKQIANGAPTPRHRGKK